MTVKRHELTSHLSITMNRIHKLKQVYPWVQTPLVVGAPMRLISLADLAVSISRAGKFEVMSFPPFYVIFDALSFSSLFNNEFNSSSQYFHSFSTHIQVFVSKESPWTVFNCNLTIMQEASAS